MDRRGSILPTALPAALFVAVPVAVLTLLLAAAPCRATPGYADETGKPCAYCHVSPGGPLTPDGVAFAERGYRLPTATTGPRDGRAEEGENDTRADMGQAGTGEEEAGQADSPSPERRGPVLSLPGWARGVLRALHIVAVIAWFGGMITVLVVQRPQVALAGIPRGYLMLAWPAIGLVGLSGLLLTLADVSGVGTLTAGRWGALLLTKLALCLVLATAAGMATLVVSPRLERAAASRRAPSATSQEQYRAQGRITVRYDGAVYDITGSRLWPEGRHMKQHDAWEDLTDAMARAPHGPQVLDRFTVLEDAGRGRMPAVQRVFLVMVYVNAALMATVIVIVAVW